MADRERLTALLMAGAGDCLGKGRALNCSKLADYLFEHGVIVLPADVVEVRHGKWVEDSYYNIPCVCSCCGAEAQYTSTFEETFDYDWEENLCPTGYEETREYIRTPFCPNCGAKMDGGNNNVTC